MTIKIYKRGNTYEVSLPGGVTVSGHDLQRIKDHASYAYRIFNGIAKFEIVQE